VFSRLRDEGRPVVGTSPRGKQVRWLAVLTIFALIAASCGADDDAETDGDETTSSEAAEEPAEEPADEPAEEPAARSRQRDADCRRRRAHAGVERRNARCARVSGRPAPILHYRHRPFLP
jgi:hypothetical protein